VTKRIPPAPPRPLKSGVGTKPTVASKLSSASAKAKRPPDTACDRRSQTGKGIENFSLRLSSLTVSLKRKKIAFYNGFSFKTTFLCKNFPSRKMVSPMLSPVRWSRIMPIKSSDELTFSLFNSVTTSPPIISNEFPT